MVLSEEDYGTDELCNIVDQHDLDADRIDKLLRLFKLNYHIMT